jgi:hypothetical protein
MRRREIFGLLLARWGFAVSVAAAIAVGFGVAMTVTLPTDIPSVAIRAAAVYRVEVGVAVFFGIYVVTIAFALALRNRGFTEIGNGGIRAQDLAAVSDAVVAEAVSIELLEEVMDEVGDLRSWREKSESVR